MENIIPNHKSLMHVPNSDSKYLLSSFSFKFKLIINGMKCLNFETHRVNYAEKSYVVKFDPTHKTLFREDQNFFKTKLNYLLKLNT